ncbi:MAG: Asp-tRNA(Asn)/Glu-tRNA(Gln) amidotransferase GatCAB subunit B [Candidatus Chloroheliales bacterium]|nr:MAG: Asp-tRNA(Asn)/Glu-tRNA(Gln) amidotransferase GatCAB subunit B [Chloroflexota bacterium]
MTSVLEQEAAPADELEVTIGLEVHAQVLTASKMFCACRADYAGAPPNTQACPICLGMPGTLPTINQQAVEKVILTGLALNCEIAPFSKFDRKNYPYPDLMKGYQISQYDLPICVGGWLEIDLPDGGTKKVGITRVHMEEDTAKLLHVGREHGGEQYALLDVNRSGVPLMEIVGEPDLSSPEEARRYLVKLRQMLRYLEVSSGNMEEGSFRCDANISLRPRGQQAYGNRAEVKNMNSFSAVFHALEYEIKRQSELLRSGQRVEQETRGWVETRGVTRSQRSKEFAHDYRYFPEPDLPPLVTSADEIERLRATLPELPDAKRARFLSEYGLDEESAHLLTASRGGADYYETAVAAFRLDDPAKLREAAKWVANWVRGELFRLLRESGHELEDARVTPAQLASLISLTQGDTISQSVGKQLLAELYANPDPKLKPADIVAERGLAKVSDAGELEAVVRQVIAANPSLVEQYRTKPTVMIAFIGRVMGATKGKGDAKVIEQLLHKLLDGEVK